MQQVSAGRAAEEGVTAKVWISYQRKMPNHVCRTALSVRICNKRLKIMIISHGLLYISGRYGPTSKKQACKKLRLLTFVGTLF